ncbi:MAG: hypothetical protein HYZ31_09025 [Gammaproteobacteria bacterium]|nr:hypothetical protein [Gammaproteobacteria bacterium]
MRSNNEQQLKVIKRKIFRLQLFGAPGAIILGLGLYSLFGANGQAFHPALNNSNVVFSLLAAGITIEIWQFLQLLPLLKEQAKLINSKNV